MEGALRVPMIIRWPNKIPAGKVTNEIIHVVDLFPTLAHIANLEVPKDRVIDGVDQSEFLLGKQEKSNREGFVYFIKTELRAAKWRDWKMHFVWEVEPNDGANHLETPYLFNIVQDPKEESDVNSTQGWVRGPIRKMVMNFQNSLKEHPPIPPGAPDEFQPK
jgi:arylsulfatase